MIGFPKRKFILPNNKFFGADSKFVKSFIIKEISARYDKA